MFSGSAGNSPGEHKVAVNIIRLHVRREAQPVLFFGGGENRQTSPGRNNTFSVAVSRTDLDLRICQDQSAHQAYSSRSGGPDQFLTCTWVEGGHDICLSYNVHGVRVDFQSQTHKHTYTNTSTHPSIQSHTCAHTQHICTQSTCACTRICTCRSTHAQTRAHRETQAQTRTHTHITHSCTRPGMHVRTLACTHTHVHTQTLTL